MHALLLASSALFAWSMGSHYTGSVAGTAYGADVFSVRTALLPTAALTVVGSVVRQRQRCRHNASINQTIIGGVVGAGASVARSRTRRRIVRKIALNWTPSPLLGLAGSALATVVLETVVT